MVIYYDQPILCRNTFLRGLKYSPRNEKEKALEEFEKVIKNSPNFLKKNDDLIFHIPGELKAIFNLYSL